MRKRSLSAVSISALLLATAACGDNNNAYESAEVETVEEDADRTAYNDPAYNDVEDADEYADARSTARTTTSTDAYGNPSADTAAQDTNAYSSSYRTASTDLRRSKAEIEALATSAFESADADNDGVLDRDEYVELALASARDFDTFVTEPVRLMSVTPVTDPETMTPDSDDIASDDTMSGDLTDEAPLSEQRTADATVTLDATETAEIKSAAAVTFDNAAGGDDELTAEELRATFLARFEEADQDGDDELDEAELRTFAALTRGEQ